MSSLRWLSCWALVSCVLLSPCAAQAQTLLQRLENRLNEVLAPPAGAPRENLPPAAEEIRRQALPGFLGLVVDLDPTSNRLKVTGVRPGSPAEVAGLKVNDELVAIEGEELRTLDEMERLLKRYPAGSRLALDVRRDGRNERRHATLVPRAGAGPIAPELHAAPEVGGPRVMERPSLGVTVVGVTEEVREQFGLTVRRGAVITAIRPGSAADRFHLPIGGAIVAFDGRRIDSSDDLIQAVNNARPGQEVELSYYEGNTLHRRRLTLSPELAVPVPATRPGSEPPLVLNPDEPGDAPALRKLEKMLGGVLGGGPERNPRPTPAAPIDEMTALRQQIESLQSQLTTLQRRVNELESRLEEKLPQVEKP